MRDRKNDHHRRVVESRLGRKLKTDEVVDHVNEDKTDNTPANLRVVDRGAHTSQHNKTRHVSTLRKALRMPKNNEKLY